MCDYSLMAVPNRLAAEQEILVVHRFPTGSLGLTSPAELERVAAPRQKKGFWAAVRHFLAPHQGPQVCAVCIPPGARLLLSGIPPRLQAELGVGPEEEVTFTQITANACSYRDSVRFAHGRVLRLQELREGQQVKVLDLAGADGGYEPASEEHPEILYRLR